MPYVVAPGMLVRDSQSVVWLVGSCTTLTTCKGFVLTRQCVEERVLTRVCEGHLDVNRKHVAVRCNRETVRPKHVCVRCVVVRYRRDLVGRIG